MEETEAFKELTEIMRNTPPSPPPEDFTPRVMKAVRKEEGLLERCRRILWRPCVSRPDPGRKVGTGSKQHDISSYFLLIAFAHLSLGVVLLAGYSHIDRVTSLPGLFGIQPCVSFILAIWLGVWGGLVKWDIKHGNRTGGRGAQFAAMIYSEAVLINGALLLMAFRNLPFLIPFVTIAVVVAVAAGIFLAINCRNGKTGTTGGASIPT